MPLISAAAAGQISVVKYLIDRSAIVDAVDSCGDSALHMAAKRGDVALIKLLIEHKASINIDNDDRETPIYNAVRGGHFGAVVYLTEQRASVTWLNDRGETPISLAATYNKADIVAYFANMFGRQHQQVTRNCTFSSIKEITNDECSICYCELGTSDAANISVLTCMHGFHGDCLAQWLTRNKNCPLCRRTIV